MILQIGGNVRNIRKIKGFSIDEIRELTGLSKSTISDLENDKSNPTIETLNRLSQALSIDIIELFKKELNDTEPCNAVSNSIKIENKDNFIELISRDNTNDEDIERIALFYIIAENEDLYSNVEGIYNFEKHGITPYIALSENGRYDFHGSSRSLLKIAYNLYDGYPADILGTLYNLDENDYRIALNAINIRLRGNGIEI